LGLRALGQVQEQEHHLEALALFALGALHDDATTADIDLLIATRRRARQAHSHADFGPFVDECVGKERDALGLKSKTLSRTAALRGRLPFRSASKTPETSRLVTPMITSIASSEISLGQCSIDPALCQRSDDLATTG